MSSMKIEDLKSKILSYAEDEIDDEIDSDFECNEPDFEYAVRSALADRRVFSHKINVDCENADLIGSYNMPGTEKLPQFEMIGNIPVAWCAMGGDWEMPIVVMLYADSDGNLKAYVPKNGNAYCKAENCAWGNERNSEFNENTDYVFDLAELHRDAENMLKIRGIF